MSQHEDWLDEIDESGVELSAEARYAVFRASIEPEIQSKRQREEETPRFKKRGGQPHSFKPWKKKPIK